MKNYFILVVAAAAFMLSSAAFGQCTGQFASGQTCANATGSRAAPTGVSESSYFDFLYGAVPGTIIYRGPSGWTSLPGNSSGTNVLSENASGVPSWIAAAGTGTVTSVALSLPGIFTVSGSPVTSAGTLTATLATQSQNLVFAAPNGSGGAPTFRALVLPDFPAIGANTVLVNAASGSAVPTAQIVPSCSTATSALIWTTNTGFGCQTITGTGTVTSVATGTGLTGGTITTTGTISLATIGADSVLGNATAGTAAPGAMALTSCSAAQSALTYNTSTHAFGCNLISGSGTVITGVAGQIAWYSGNSNVIQGSLNANISGGVITLGVANTTIGGVVLEGGTSGAVTLTPQSTAGTPTLTFGTSSGTPVVTASSPLAITAATGNLTITGVAGQVLGGAGPAFTATPTLGAASVATGQLKISGTTSGTVTLTTADAAGTWTLKVPTSGGTSGQFLTTDGTGITSWASPSGSGTVNAATSGQIAYYASNGTAVSGNANANIATGTLTLGQAASTQGILVLEGSSSGALTLTTQAAAGTPTWTAGTASGTPAVTASSPLAITTATGNIACATCVTSSGGGAITGTSPISVSAAGVVSVTSVSALMTYLASANNAAPYLTLYNANTTDVNNFLSTFGNAAVITGLSGTILGTPSGAGVAGGAFQTVRNDAGGCVAGAGMCTIFSVATSGYNNITSTGTGNYGYAMFARQDVNNANGSGVGLEADCNNVVADSPTTLPPNLNAPVVGSPCIGIQSVNMGAKNSLAAFRAVTIGQIGGPASWVVSYYADAPTAAGNLYGMFIDATSTLSPTTSALFRNSGQGSNVPLKVQWMGSTVAANHAIEVLDSSANVVWRVNQQGGTVVNTSFAGGINFAVANNDTGASSTAGHSATTNAGSMSTVATTTAGGSVGALRWTGPGALFVDDLNDTSHIDLRVKAAAVSAMQLMPTGHINNGAGSGPTLSSCGTSPSLSTNATDFAGVVTTGTVTTGCTITFANSYTSTPTCWVSDLTGVRTGMGVTVSAINIVVTGNTVSDKLFYGCFGQTGGA